jgi:kynureninase
MRLSEALKAKGVVVDFRRPNVIRVAPVPLYNTYCEIWQAIQHLKKIVDEKEFERFSEKRKAIS